MYTSRIRLQATSERISMMDGASPTDPSSLERNAGTSSEAPATPSPFFKRPLGGYGMAWPVSSYEAIMERRQ